MIFSRVARRPLTSVHAIFVKNTAFPSLSCLTPANPAGTYYYVRKAVVILFPAYVLCCMFEVLDPPRPMMENAWDALVHRLGDGPRVFSAAELKAKGAGSRPMLRFVVVVVVIAAAAAAVVVRARKYWSSPGLGRGYPPLEGVIFARTKKQKHNLSTHTDTLMR